MLQLLKINNEEVGFCDKYSQNQDKKTWIFNIIDVNFNEAPLEIPFTMIKNFNGGDGVINLFLKF